jgi:hypothetical protein
MALSEKSILDNIKNGSIEGSGYKKPSMSYAQLIAEALNNAPEKTLVLSDIYKAINARYPYYELETRGWQNSLRHTLTLNKSFVKEQKDRTDLKRGWLWKLAEGHSIPAIGVKKRDHICSDCNIGFASRTTLKNHKIATGHEGKLQKSEEGYIKPCMSYAQLIAETLNNTPEKTLVLSDICKAINAKYPYYELETQGWQNSIRHTLTLNKNFIKGHKVSFEKRGWYWKLQEDHSIRPVKALKVSANTKYVLSVKRVSLPLTN